MAIPEAVQNLCEVVGVTHEFRQPNGRPLVVLRDITLGIRPREVIALLGPSGCGKSTLLRILAGLIQPTRGTVLYRGSPFTGINPGMALVFQSFALFPWMTVDENIRTVLEAAGLTPADIAERVAHAIKRVGLAGFAQAYPRELSGGMKQRVGVARAIALDPEILFLDEPFCHVDALTAEGLRAEVLDLWSAPGGNPSSIVLVSHDIAEVVQMADRIVLLGANPGQVRQIVPNPLPRPRDLRSPAAQQLIDRLHDLITGHELPDPDVPLVADRLDALPTVRANQVIGLLEMLDARGGDEDLFRLIDDTGHEYGILIQVVKAAELLGCVVTPKRQVVLTENGRNLVRADLTHRPVLWRACLGKVAIINQMVELVKKRGAAGLNREVIIEALILALPGEDYDQQFATLIAWCRIGELLHFDKKSGIVSMAVPAHQTQVPQMDLAPFLDPQRVLLMDGQPAKTEVLVRLAGLIATAPSVGDGPAFTAAVQSRESVANTGAGHRVALPHAQLDSVREFVIAIAVIRAGCDFAAADGQTVQVVAMIAAPIRDRPRYLKVLSALAARLNQAELRERIVQAQHPDQVIAALTDVAA